MAQQTEKGDHSSGEYSGVVEEATVAVSGKPSQLAAVISSGQSAKKEREDKKARRAMEQAITSGNSAKTDREERKARREKEAAKGK